VKDDICGIVLAAGAGTRMKSKLSKVLHRLAGRPLLHYPVLAAVEAGARDVIVVASPVNRRDVEGCLGELELPPGVSVTIAVQEQARGTGDAARAALGELKRGWALILNGDIPLIRADDLLPLLDACTERACKLALLSCQLDDPSGYGRILRDTAGKVREIREQKDLQDQQQRDVREVNAGVYLVESELLRRTLGNLRNDNAQSEFYVTDIVADAAATERVVAATGEPAVLQGINDRQQLANLEAVLFERIASRHRLAGVTVEAGARIDDAVSIGRDTTIRANVSLRGRTVVGEGCVVDQGSVLDAAHLGRDVNVKPYCVIVDSRVGDGAQIGPFAHLRPGSELQDDVHVGNFVETKKTRMARGAKANHLAYLGDTDVGEASNIGAGTIVCNYDGFSKERTVIGKGAFIGSDSQLIAPVRVGDGAYVGTGTTLTQDAPDGSLVLGRPQLVVKEGYATRLRQRLKAKADAKKRHH